MTDRDALLEARIARRVTANWTKIKQSKVTPLEVAQDIVRALAETHALAAEPPALDVDRLGEAIWIHAMDHGISHPCSNKCGGAVAAIYATGDVLAPLQPDPQP